MTNQRSLQVSSLDANGTKRVGTYIQRVVLPTLTRQVVFVCCLAHGMAQSSPAEPGGVVDFFAEFSLENPAGGLPLLPGRLYLPPEANADPRPLILFLHGAGESGTDNVRQVCRNIDDLIVESALSGSFLYAPQTHLGWHGRTVADQVMSMVDRAIALYAVDPARIYVTGLSMGGSGTWNMLHWYGERFAAGVPVAGASPGFDFQPASLLDEPIWAFHARRDPVVPVEFTREVLDSVIEAGGGSPPNYPPLDARGDFQFAATSLDLRYTEYDRDDHNDGVWNTVYRTPELYDWMYSHRSAAVPEPHLGPIAGIAFLAIGHNLLRSVLGQSPTRVGFATLRAF